MFLKMNLYKGCGCTYQEVRVSEKVRMLVSQGIDNIAVEVTCAKRIVSECLSASSTVEVNGVVAVLGWLSWKRPTTLLKERKDLR
jgi:hypothetical protein